MSSQIIAYTERLDFKTLLDIECKSLTGFAPVVKETVDDLTSLLNLLSDIDILIVDEPNCKAKAKLIFDLLSSKSQEIKKILFLGEEKVDLTNVKSFPVNQIEDFVSHLKGMLDSSGAQTLEYISVPADSLIHFKVLPFDLYIKISENKFIKRIPANEDVDDSTIEAFKQKGIVDLYFEKKYNRDFSLMLLNNMINKVETDYSTVDAKLKARNEVFVTTKEIVQSVGLPPRVIQVCESVMDSISEDVIKSKDRFGNYLEQVKSQSNLNFQFQLIELTSFIATQLLDNGTEANAEQIKKVVFAAFFCDIALSDVSHLDCRSEDSLKDLWSEDKQMISEHAQKASLLVSKYKNAPGEVDIIIKQHHGSLDGIGFKPVSDGLHPLAKCLIASQELAFAILKSPEVAPIETIKRVADNHAGTPIHGLLVSFSESFKANL